MTDPVLRLLIVVLVIGVAAGVAAAQRRGTAWRRRPAELPGLPAGVYLFTSTTCASCPAARESLTAVLGPSGFAEIAFEDRPEVFARCGIARVPALAVVEEGGRSWRAEGVVPARRVRRWVLERSPADS